MARWQQSCRFLQLYAYTGLGDGLVEAESVSFELTHWQMTCAEAKAVFDGWLGRKALRRAGLPAIAAAMRLHTTWPTAAPTRRCAIPIRRHTSAPARTVSPVRRSETVSR